MWVPIYVLIHSVDTTNRSDQLQDVWKGAICTEGYEHYTAGICTFKVSLCVEVCVHFTEPKLPYSICVITIIYVVTIVTTVPALSATNMRLTFTMFAACRHRQ